MRKWNNSINPSNEGYALLLVQNQLLDAICITRKIRWSTICNEYYRLLKSYEVTSLWQGIPVAYKAIVHNSREVHIRSNMSNNELWNNYLNSICYTYLEVGVVVNYKIYYVLHSKEIKWSRKESSYASSTRWQNKL